MAKEAELDTERERNSSSSSLEQPAVKLKVGTIMDSALNQERKVILH